jgi:hypothetical protein
LSKEKPASPFLFHKPYPFQYLFHDLFQVRILCPFLHLVLLRNPVNQNLNNNLILFRSWDPVPLIRYDLLLA